MNIRTPVQILAVSIAAIALYGCGGGGGDSGTSGAVLQPSGNSNLTPTSAPSSVVQNVEYYGDSTVYGYASGSTGTQVATPAPTAFAQNLPAASRYAVANEGVSGTTACQLLDGRDGKHPDWATQMVNSKAKFVIINHAINDERTDIGENVASYSGCLTSLATGARKAGKIVIFETPNPTDQSGQGLENYVAAMKTVASNLAIPVIDQYQYLLGKLGPGGATGDVRSLMPDGTHPSDATYIDKGQFAAREFLKMSF